MGSPPEVGTPPTGPTQQQRLTRPRDDRMIAGVASGLARYLGIDPTLVRIAFVVLAVAGGAGVLAYLVAWVLMPEGNGAAIEPRSARGNGASVVGFVLVALGSLLLLDRLLPDLSWRFVAPAVLVALGLVLLLGGRRDPR